MMSKFAVGAAMGALFAANAGAIQRPDLFWLVVAAIALALLIALIELRLARRL